MATCWSMMNSIKAIAGLISIQRLLLSATGPVSCRLSGQTQRNHGSNLFQAAIHYSGRLDLTHRILEGTRWAYHRGGMTTEPHSQRLIGTKLSWALGSSFLMDRGTRLMSHKRRSTAKTH